MDTTVVVAAGGAAGAAYALGALAQMIEDGSTGAGARLARVRVEDGPTWGWRGVHLDVARHFFPVADVCRLIDLAALHRLNRLHLHLNDDQGWRVEVPGWERLTTVGAWRASTPVGRESDGVDDHIPYGGFYSAEDLEAIRAHAARRFVTVVPEIDLPGHAQAVLAAYPEPGEGEAVEVWTRWGISEHVLDVGEDALAFAEEVTCYVAGLFPASPVHVGGDSARPPSGSTARRRARSWTPTASSTRANSRACSPPASPRRCGPGATRSSPGTRSSDSGVPPGVTVVAWRGVKKGAEAARAGHDVVMAPMTFLYFDWLSADAPGKPVAQSPAPLATTWEKVYGFAWCPTASRPSTSTTYAAPRPSCGPSTSPRATTWTTWRSPGCAPSPRSPGGRRATSRSSALASRITWPGCRAGASRSDRWTRRESVAGDAPR